MFVGTHTQNGYVCDDIAAGIDLFRGRGLEREPTIIPVDQIVQTPDGPKRQQTHLTMFWLNGLQYELIQPIVDETNVYVNAPSNGGLIRFHHINMKVDDWEAFRAGVHRQPFPVAFEGGGDNLKFLYLDARKALGHYLEYTWMTDAMWEQIKAI
jgi:hypothetical protein